MAVRTQTYDLTSDFTEHYEQNLRFLLWITFIVAVPMLGLETIFRSEARPLSLYLFGALAITMLFSRQKMLSAAIWTFIAGFAVLPIIELQASGLNNTSLALLPLAVIICSLLRTRNAVVVTAIATVAALFGAAWLQSNLGTALNYVFVPGLMTLAIATAVYVNETNTMDMVYWAMDIQSKDTQRAEMFYEQKVQLSEAMLQVQHVNSALENLNKKLEIAQHKAEQASQAKTVFLSNMSHELRTPLNIVIGYSSSMLNMPQMFDNVKLPEIYHPYLKLVEDNGHYLLGLINDILDLSKIEAGRLELHSTPVALPDLLRGTLSTSIGLLKDKPLQLRPDFSEDLPAVWADPLRVRQIILNLLSNAIKFTHTGSVTLSARVEGNRVRVAVTDTGIGIPEKAIATIFDRFQQAEHDTDKHYGGTGLGLDISKQLSLMHGGDLTLHSVLNQGSIFSFTLPLLEVEQVTVEQPFETINDTVHVFDSQAETVPESHVILLVEDEVNTREALHKALETAGYVVIDAHDGDRALELAMGLLPDLILLDAYLPGIDGWELLKELKSNPETESTPIIMISAAPNSQLAYDLGAELMLEKPVAPDEVIACIQTILLPVRETN